MKLVVATGLYAPEIGGPATYTALLERHLPKHGIELTVLPFSTVRWYPKIIRHFAYTLRLIRLSRGADAFYALDAVSVGLPVRIAAWITCTPYLLRVPGEYAWEQGTTRFGIAVTLDEFQHLTSVPFPVRVLRGIERSVARHARHVIVPSEYLGRIVGGWGVPRERITRIYSALEPTGPSESRDALRTKFGYRGFVISSAGRLVPWKGMETLLVVLKELHTKGVSATFDIIGDGVCRRELERKAADVGVQAYVTFHGALSREVLTARISASDVFVLNTGYEGLSHQLLEVMHLGVPIVTTPVGGNTELIADRDTGLLVQPNDVDGFVAALTELIDHPELGRSLSARARSRVAAFHEDVVTKELVTLLHSLWTFSS